MQIDRWRGGRNSWKEWEEKEGKKGKVGIDVLYEVLLSYMKYRCPVWGPDVPYNVEGWNQTSKGTCVWLPKSSWWYRKREAAMKFVRTCTGEERGLITMGARTNMAALNRWKLSQDELLHQLSVWWHIFWGSVINTCSAPLNSSGFYWGITVSM